ncbi:AbrB family transcriptional regulator [Pseudodesulfovibrio indicus]|nr:AbrB family transcriptional regulator [Pseudodesulfovibrio indicus]
MPTGGPGATETLPYRRQQQPAVTSAPRWETMQQIIHLALIMAAALAGGLLASRLNIPGSVIIGAMLGVIVLKLCLALPLALPRQWSLFIQIVVGATVGSSFSVDMLGQLRHYAVPILTSALLLIILGSVMAIVFTKFWGIDPGTAFISTSPGAMTAMTGMAGGLNVDIFLVLTFHITRVILVILLAPAIMRLSRMFL